MTYTWCAAAAVLLTTGLDILVLRVRLLTRRAFWVSYAIILFFQLVTNAVLTGLPVVVYNPQAILGARIAFAPVEDLLFGFALVLLTLDVWVALGRVSLRGEQRAGGGSTARSPEQ